VKLVFEPGRLNERYNAIFRARDLDALVALYEPDAVLSPQPGLEVRGAAAIRERLAGLIALTGSLESRDHVCIVSGDIALLRATWRFEGRSSSGAPVSLGGRSAKVARRQGDRSWRYVLDVPHGGEVSPP
jgi:ketosteroid isomerase-like protein